MILKNLQLYRGGIRLVEGGDLPLEPGKVTVLFGPSGGGKSSLLYGLADLDRDVVLKAGGHSRPLAKTRVGLVPQQSAVFEDMKTAGKNLQFAFDHLPKNEQDTGKKALEWAENALGVKAGWTFPLSGGQKQRVAIARALAGNAQVLLLDEPTSGLDPASRADAIRIVNEAAKTGVAVLVVTHDLEWNHPDGADTVLLLKNRRLETHAPGIPLSASFFQATKEAAFREAPPAWERLFARWGELIWWFLSVPLQILLGFRGCARVRAKWLGHFLRHFSQLVAGPSSAVYVAIAGLLVGFSSLYFSVGALRPSPHLQAILLPELLSGSGLGLYRVIIPLISALLLSAKCGSALAADIGNRTYGGQMGVMRAMDTNPESYLLLPALLAFAIGLPLLSFLAFAFASSGSLFGYLLSFPSETFFSWNANFFRLLRPRSGSILWDGTLWNIAKLACSGTGVATIAYYCGTLPKSSNTDVGRDISRATLWSSLWCLVVFALFALVEF